MCSTVLKCLAVFSFVLSISVTKAQSPKNWDEKQLIESAELATIINTNNSIPIIISVGPGAVIPHSVNAGMANSKEGIEKLKSVLQNIAKTEKIVLYCGCCPFEHCPNVRPAIDLLKEWKFTNYYLLNLSTNIKVDWIDKGYPVKNK